MLREGREPPAAAAHLGECGRDFRERLPARERLAECVFVVGGEHGLSISQCPQAAGHHLAVGRTRMLALHLRLVLVVAVEAVGGFGQGQRRPRVAAMPPFQSISVP